MSEKRAGRCLRCKDAGQRPRYVEEVPEITFYAPIMMPGQPTLRTRRLGAEHMADYIWHQGVSSAMRDYELSKADVLVVVWWAGQWGPRRFRQRWGQWARDEADGHLWSSCVRVPDPPTIEEQA